MVLYFRVPNTEELNNCLRAPSGECMYEDDLYEDDDQYKIKAIHLVDENGNISRIDISFQISYEGVEGVPNGDYDIGRIEFTIIQPPDHRLHATIFQLSAGTTHAHLTECFNRIKKKITNLIHDVHVIDPPDPLIDVEERQSGTVLKRPNSTVAGGARKKKSKKSKKAKKTKKSRKIKRSIRL